MNIPTTRIIIEDHSGSTFAVKVGESFMVRIVENRNPRFGSNWLSYIAGGAVVLNGEIEHDDRDENSNYTLNGHLTARLIAKQPGQSVLTVRHQGKDAHGNIVILKTLTYTFNVT